MPLHTDRGKLGEDLAAGWLTMNGFSVLHRNWRYRHWEVDIIATRGDILHFIEVKYRRSKAFGPPEASVVSKKLRNMMKGAMGWKRGHTSNCRIQYDVLSIMSLPDQPTSYLLLEDISL
jgi:putative endonuclease